MPFGSDDTGTSWILEIDGDDWLRKYSSGYNSEFTAISRSGNLGISMFGVVGVINVVLCTLIWFYYLGKEYDCGNSFCLYSNDFWWYTWFSLFVVHLFLWAPVTIMWPVAYIGSLTPLMFLRVFCYLTLAGPYGLYEGVLVAALLAFIVWTDTSGHTERGWSSNAGIIWVSSYIGLVGVSAFV